MKSINYFLSIKNVIFLIFSRIPAKHPIDRHFKQIKVKIRSTFQIDSSQIMMS